MDTSGNWEAQTEFNMSIFESEKLKVLIIDDEMMIRIFVSEILKDIGVSHIEQAAGGSKAIEMMRKGFRPDAILTDRQMPNGDGVGVIHWVRNHPDSPNPYMPIMMVSGNATRKEVAEARDAGANEFLAKPISPDLVHRRMRVLFSSMRPFIQNDDFFGPERRRRSLKNVSMERRLNTTLHIDDTAFLAADQDERDGARGQVFTQT